MLRSDSAIGYALTSLRRKDASGFAAVTRRLPCQWQNGNNKIICCLCFLPNSWLVMNFVAWRPLGKPSHGERERQMSECRSLDAIFCCIVAKQPGASLKSGQSFTFCVAQKLFVEESEVLLHRLSKTVQSRSRVWGLQAHYFPTLLYHRLKVWSWFLLRKLTSYEMRRYLFLDQHSISI